MVIQLARFAGLRVIASASRAASVAWCRKLGAQDIVNHGESLPAQLGELGLPLVDYVFNCADLAQHFVASTEVLAPFGSLVTILDASTPVDASLLRPKSLRLAYELMFTRPLYRRPDMIEQHRLLDAAAKLFDAGTLVGTRTQTLPRIDAANLRAAHAQLESGHTIGKLVLENF
jgi:NADPH:quinone reductase-like Zn-dependent oxidoreductase